MIRFNCLCGHQFELPDDEAGALIQCPDCRKLNDVPTLGDLQSIDDAGYKLDDIPVAPDPDGDHVAAAARAFTRRRVDEQGEIDLRNTVEEVLAAGSVEIPLDAHDVALPGRPKYDPVTGELIRPIDVKPDDRIPEDPAAVPMAKPALNYAALYEDRPTGIWGTMLALLRPMNLFVMLIILLAHLFFELVLLVTLVMIFTFPGLILLFAFIVSHYGNVIDEIGPTGHDELPRPLRDVHLYDDLWRPFTMVGLSLLLCYAPLIPIYTWPLPHKGLLALAAAGLGTLLLPAVLLTATTSGTILNLRPDRVLGVVRRIGVAYPFAVLSFAGAAVTYALGLMWLHAGTVATFSRGWGAGQSLVLIGSGLPVLFAGVYLMHYFCWLLGSFYRKHHDQFPWVLQRHVSTRRHDTTRQLEQFRSAARAGLLQPPGAATDRRK